MAEQIDRRHLDVTHGWLHPKGDKCDRKPRVGLGAKLIRDLKCGRIWMWLMDSTGTNATKKLMRQEDIDTIKVRAH